MEDEQIMDINQVIEAIDQRDVLKLRELAGDYTDEAALNQDQEEINLALITYSFNKIYGKVHLREKTKDLDFKAIEKLKNGEYQQVVEEIKKFDAEHGLFHDGLIRKARIKIGSRLSSQGISMSTAAALVDTNISDLLDYVGSTKDHDHHQGKSLEERLNSARKAIDA